LKKRKKFWTKKREAKLRVKNQIIKYFNAKLRFALFDSLRSASILASFLAWLQPFLANFTNFFFKTALEFSLL